MKATFEPNGQPTPETCAGVLGKYLRVAALQTCPVDFGILFWAVIRDFATTEEQIGGEIHTAHFMLARAGLISSTTPGRISGDTQVCTSRRLRRFVWAPETLWHDEDDSND